VISKRRVDGGKHTGHQTKNRTCGFFLPGVTREEKNEDGARSPTTLHPECANLHG
jgi:hypothetical protein